MFKKKNKSNMTDIEKKLYEKEIKSLQAKLQKNAKLLEIANKYKNEYKDLRDQYEEKLEELNRLKVQTDNLQEELRILIDQAKKELDKNN